MVYSRTLLLRHRLYCNSDGILFDGACGSDMKAIPIVLLKGGQLVVGACGSDMKAVPSCLLNGGRLVIDVASCDQDGHAVRRGQSPESTRGHTFTRETPTVTSCPQRVSTSQPSTKALSSPSGAKHSPPSLGLGCPKR